MFTRQLVKFHPNMLPEHEEFESAVLNEYYLRKRVPTEIWRYKGNSELPGFSSLKQRMQKMQRKRELKVRTQVFVSTNQSEGISQLHRDGLRKSLLIYASEGCEGTTIWIPKSKEDITNLALFPQELCESNYTPFMNIVPYAGLGIEYKSTLAHTRAIGTHTRPRVAILASFE